MADVLVHRIQFIDTNPFGEFVAGDELTFYYDNATPIPHGFTDGLSVFKNGIEIFTGNDIPIAPGTTYTEQYLVPNGVCNGTTSISPAHLSMSFPYLLMIGFPDFPGCAVNPPTCNLQIIGVPVITPATGETESDGVIALSVSSTELVQYRLGSDFVYNDGTGTAVVAGVATISGLLPGQYRVYFRDALNCFANVLVTVGFTEAYGPLNRLEFDSLAGHVCRIDISKFAYTGDVTEVIGADIAFTRDLRGEGSENKFETILATSVTIGLTSETNFQFQSIYTNNPEEFRPYFYRNGVLKGIYKVLPQQYEEDYKASPYYVKVVATDGLPSLKDFPFIQDGGDPFNGSMKAIELIAFILKKTRLNINIRVAINLYATTMAATDSDDPLDQAYVDTDTYYIHEAAPTCDYVLRQILEPFGVRLFQENAVWNILRVEELIDEYDYREFDSDGVYVSNSSYDPIVEIVNPGSDLTGKAVLSDVNHYMKLCPGYGKVRIFYKLGLRQNIFENGDFRLKYRFVTGIGYIGEVDTFGWQLVQSDYVLTSGLERVNDGDSSNVAWKITGGDDITVNTGEAYILSDTYTVKMGAANSLRFKFRYKVPAPVVGTINVALEYITQTINIPYQKVRIIVRYGDYYLTAGGGWTTAVNIITVFVTEFDKFLETEITAPQPHADATSGFDLTARIYHSYIYHSEYIAYADLKARPTFDAGDFILPTGTRSEVQTTPGGSSYLEYYELEDNTDAESSPTILRPDDYHAVDNPRQWIRKTRVSKIILTGSFTTPFWLDKVTCEFLTNGEQSVDTIVREVPAESRNTAILEKEVTHGSYQSLITTLFFFGISGSSSQTTNILSADILYAGYFRDVNGVGYEIWARDGVAEETSLHLTLSRQLAVQYARSWQKITGSLYSPNRPFTFLDVFSMTNDDDRKYLPISGSIDELNNRFNGEFLELIDYTESGGGSSFSSGFTIGFGGGYD